MNVIVKAMAGSHLFGTNTPQSDKDYKGVYLPSFREVALSQVKDTVSIKTNKSNEKNTKEDVDIEYYSLKKFMEMLYQGQTAAIELLWTPEDLILEKNHIWDFLVSKREEFLHKKVSAFVGYCKTQADKYGIKGSRLNAVEKALDYFKTKDREEKLKDFKEELERTLSKVEHIEFGFQESENGPLKYLEVSNRKLQYSTKVGYCVDQLEKIKENYGARAEQAKRNDGIDWKAMSHAYRVASQAIEILEEHKLTLPLPVKTREIVTSIKKGERAFLDVKPELEELINKVLVLEKESTLKSEFDYKHWCEDFIVEVYRKELEALTKAKEVNELAKLLGEDHWEMKN